MKSSEESFIKGTFNNFGKCGHKSLDCWLFDKNKHKLQSIFKMEETGNATSEKYCLICHEIDNEIQSVNVKEYEFEETAKYCMMCHEISEDDSKNKNEAEFGEKIYRFGM